MYLWKLARIGSDEPVNHDELRAIVVMAMTESGARELAGGNAGDEGWRVWFDTDETNCIAIGETISYLDTTTLPAVICRDFVEA